MSAHCPLCQVTSGHIAHTPAAVPPHPPLRTADAAGRSPRTALLLAQLLVLLGACYLFPVGGLIAVLVTVAVAWFRRTRTTARAPRHRTCPRTD